MIKNLLGFLLLVLGIGLVNVAAQTESEIKTVSKGVLNGSAVSLPKPIYPPAARAVKASGAVNVQALVDENGNVISAAAVSGHPLLRAASVQAARAAKFKPTILSGQAVKVTGVIVYNFVAPALKEGEDSEQSETESSDNQAVKGFIAGRTMDSEDSVTGSKPVLNNAALNLPKPAFPPAARAVKAQGAVNVQVLIDEDGNVVQAEAVSGHPLLRAAAVNAALGAKFKPTLLEGNPVKVNGIIVYNFVP